MNEKLQEALNEISDQHIDEAAKAKKRKKVYWFGAVAAVLVVALVVGLLRGPMVIRAEAVALADDPRLTQRPDRDDYQQYDDYKADLDAWQAINNARSATAGTALAQLAPFFTDGSIEFLSGSDENRLWSPINAGIGLAMLAELTEGSTRQQLLDLLGCDDLDALRSQVSALWETAYYDTSKGTVTLANSLWLKDGLTYQQETMDALAYHYYASVYQGNLGSSKLNSAIGAWLNNNTGGLLKNAADGISLEPDTILALYSTLYFQAKWSDEFTARNNTSALFYAPSGDRTVTYMNKALYQTYYYWGDTYAAVSMSLKNGSRMWFILPDEGLSIDDVLSSGQYMDMVLSGSWENSKYMKVNLSVPKFDVSGSQNLKTGLQNMGITDIFSELDADFTAITTDTPVWITAVNQAVRVQIDEEGVKAAVYIEIPGATSAEPPEEIIDFILDRPFLFVITKDTVPLFAGAVNEP